MTEFCHLVSTEFKASGKANLILPIPEKLDPVIPKQLKPTGYKGTNIQYRSTGAGHVEVEFL